MTNTRIYREVDAVRRLGDDIGYGHLMSICSALWRHELLRDGISGEGAFVPTVTPFLTKEGIEVSEKSMSIYYSLVDDFFNRGDTDYIPPITTTQSTINKWWCGTKGMMCEFANERGFCSITVCKKKRGIRMTASEIIRNTITNGGVFCGCTGGYIDALKEALDLLEKKEAGLLIEIPVPILSEHYYIARDRRRGIKKVKVFGIWISCNPTCNHMLIADVEGTFSTQCDFDEIGTRLLATREEAEKQ